MERYPRCRALCAGIYESRSEEAWSCLLPVLERYRAAIPEDGAGRADTDSGGSALLISYADSIVSEDGRSPLDVLSGFLETQGAAGFDYLHLLPFFPWSSDDGFSVIDYRAVAPADGSWPEVERLGHCYKLAFDLVLNHVSAESEWFRAFLAGDPAYADWFIVKPEGYDCSRVVRPRTHPLLTPFAMADGSTVRVWTTFSADQIDLNFAHPPVLAELLDILLSYVLRGARIVRLDAIAYLWKAEGHNCLHHPKTHMVVRLFRAALEELGLDCRLLTETNVPHEENISYFGSGNDEAHMVYNFALPPLVLHAFTSGDAEPLTAWAAGLGQAGVRIPPGGMLNFLASHDGVGLTPARGLVPEADFARTLAMQQERGALVSWKSTPAGPIPYELNVSWFDAMSPPELPRDLRVRAHLASYALACSLEGLPAVYIHSLLGSPNWLEGPVLRGYNRAINRRQLELDEVERDLADPDSVRSLCIQGFRSLLAARSAEPALLQGTSRVLSLYPGVFAILRWLPPPVPVSADCGQAGSGPAGCNTALLCCVNVRSEPAAVTLPRWLGTAGAAYRPLEHRGLVSGQASVQADVPRGLNLEPYDVVWLPVREM